MLICPFESSDLVNIGNEFSGMTDFFSDVLEHYIQQQGQSSGRLANLTGIPKQTIATWRTGGVKRPRHVDHILQVAKVLRLDFDETNHLISTAGHASLDTLTKKAQEDENEELLALLAFWEQRESSVPLLKTDQQEYQSSLPTQAYFFGREKELDMIADAIDLATPGWGILICGRGGIGKTSLATQAGNRGSKEEFKYKLFLSAKRRQLTVRGERGLEDFQLPNYMELLKELAMQLGEKEVAQCDPRERVKEVLRVLSKRNALIIIDNLETFSVDEQERVILFLERLPEGNKAIVTIRERPDIGMMRVVRLEKFSKADAQSVISELAGHNLYLARTNHAEREMLYDITSGSPLLLQWVCGQLGRGRCRTVAEACTYLQNAPSDNDPLEYIFGDLAKSFSRNERIVLAALTCFTQPVQLQWIAEMSGLHESEVEIALDDLAYRTIVKTDKMNTNQPHYFILPLTSNFVKRVESELITNVGAVLCEQIYALLVENGGEQYVSFSTLEFEWPRINAALPLFLEGDNDRLQDVCELLTKFLNFSGRWDDWINLSVSAGNKAATVKDFLNAGWRAYYAGFGHLLYGHWSDALEWMEQATEYWQNAGAGPFEYAHVARVRGHAYNSEGEHTVAETYFAESLQLSREAENGNQILAIRLNDWAELKRVTGEYEVAKQHYDEALQIASTLEDIPVIAIITGNLAELALDQGLWVEAEPIAFHALELAEKLNRKEIIGERSYYVAKSLHEQGKSSEALPYAQRAVSTLEKLRSHRLPPATEVLKAINIVLEIGSVSSHLEYE